MSFTENALRVKFLGRISMASTEIWSRQIDDGETVNGCKFIFDFYEKNMTGLLFTMTCQDVATDQENIYQNNYNVLLKIRF
ncbi:MAG: hypothetical protein ACKOW3_05450 [Hyphomicrobium sp.]